MVVTRSTGPRTLYADLEQARQSLGAAGLAFPLMAKPDSGRGLAASRTWRRCAVSRHVPGVRKPILQRLVPQAGRATALYARMPGTLSAPSLPDVAHGWVLPRRTPHIMPKLEARLDAVARSIREFYYGRFALRFAFLTN